jgi:hypothetical protein
MGSYSRSQPRGSPRLKVPPPVDGLVSYLGTYAVSLVQRRVGGTSIMTTYGCPEHVVFCPISALGVPAVLWLPLSCSGGASEPSEYLGILW